MSRVVGWELWVVDGCRSVMVERLKGGRGKALV